MLCESRYSHIKVLIGTVRTSFRNLKLFVFFVVDSGGMHPDYSFCTFVTTLAILFLQLKQFGRRPDSVQLGLSDNTSRSISESTSSHSSVVERDGVLMYADFDIPHPSYVFVALEEQSQDPLDMDDELKKLRIAANTQRAVLTAAGRMPPETQVSRMIAEQTKRFLAEDARASQKPENRISEPEAEKETPVCTIGAPGLGPMPSNPVQELSRMNELLLIINSRLSGRIGIILGVGRGAFAKQLLATWRSTHVYLVDPYIHNFNDYDDLGNVDDMTNQLIFEQLRRELVPFEGKFTFVRDFSFECMSS